MNTEKDIDTSSEKHTSTASFRMGGLSAIIAVVLLITAGAAIGWGLSLWWRAEAEFSAGKELLDLDRPVEAFGRCSVALSMFEQIPISIGTKIPDCQVRIGRALLKMNRPEDAMKWYEKALGVYHKGKHTEFEQTCCRCYIAEALALMGRIDEAITQYQETITLSGQIKDVEEFQANCHEAVAEQLFRRRRYEESIAQFQKAISLFQQVKQTELQQARCHRNIGSILCNVNRFDESITWYDKAIDLYQRCKGTELKQADLHHLAAVSLRKLNRPGAQEHLRRAVSLCEKIPGAEVEQANYRWALLQEQAARPASTRSAPDDPDTLFSEVKEILRLYQKGNGTEQAQANCHRAMCELQLSSGRLDDATAELESSLSLLERLKGTERERADLLLWFASEAGESKRFEEMVCKSRQALWLYQKLPDTEGERSVCRRNIEMGLRGMPPGSPAAASLPTTRTP